MARGKQLAESMHCGQCHLPKYEGRAQMPRLAGQREDYMIDAMIGYRDGKRTGADTTMSEVLPLPKASGRRGKVRCRDRA